MTSADNGPDALNRATKEAEEASAIYTDSKATSEDRGQNEVERDDRPKRRVFERKTKYFDIAIGPKVIKTGSGAFDVDDGGIPSNVNEVKIRNKAQNTRLRKLIAKASLWFVGIQIVVSDLLFGWYVLNNIHDVPVPLMLGWLSASVVEIVAILGIVASSLFPRKNGDEGHTASDICRNRTETTVPA